MDMSSRKRYQQRLHRTRLALDGEMQIDEVSLTRHWTLRITSPQKGMTKLTLLLCGELGASVHLQKEELGGACAGLRAAAEVIENVATKVDEPIPYGGLGWKCPKCGKVNSPYLHCCSCSQPQVVDVETLVQQALEEEEEG
jgi:hypothetical protein